MQDLSHLHSHWLGFQISPLSQVPLSMNCLLSHMHLSSFRLCLLLQTLASSLHLHLHVSCQSIYLVSLVVDIRLNTLTFKFLTTSGIHNFAYGSLILLQLPLHLLVLILKRKNTGSLLLTLAIYGLLLLSWSFIEVRFNGFSIDKLQLKNVIAEIITCSTNTSILLYYVILFR